MAWPPMENVEDYCDYNNGLCKHKANMIQDYMASPSLQGKFPTFEEYAHHLNDEFDRMFWDKKNGTCNHLSEQIKSLHKQQETTMTEDDKHIIDQLL